MSLHASPQRKLYRWGEGVQHQMRRAESFMTRTEMGSQYAPRKSQRRTPSRAERGSEKKNTVNQPDEPLARFVTPSSGVFVA